MACGKPVIASNVGGMQEYISDGETGILFKTENVNDLADKCIGLIENVDKWDILGRQAEECVRRTRDWSSVVSMYEKIYKDLLSY